MKIYYEQSQKRKKKKGIPLPQPANQVTEAISGEHLDS